MSKKRWKRNLRVYFLWSLALSSVLALLITLFIQSLSIPSIIVKQVEGMFNVRAQSGKMSVRWWPLIAVKLEDFAIYPRDDVANQGLPLQERQPLDLAKSVVYVPHLEISLAAGALLLQQKILVNTFLLKDVKARLSMSKKGNLNFLPLLASPKIVDGKINPNLSQKAATPKTPTTDSPPFDVRDLPVSALVEKLGIENGQIDFTLELTGNSFTMQDLNLIVSNIDVDPKNLAEHNNADVDLSLDLFIYTKAKKETGKIALDSGGSIVPFSATTGQINPEIVYELSFLAGTYLSGFGLFEPLSEFADQLSKIGLKRQDLNQLIRKFEMTQNSTVAIRFFQSRVELMRDARLSGQAFSLSLKEKSWLKISSLTQRLSGYFEIEPAPSQNSVFEGMDQTLSKQGGISIEETREIRTKYFSPLTVIYEGKEGLSLKFLATGRLTDPQVQLTVPVPDLNRMLQEVLQKRLRAEGKQLEEKLRKEAEKELQKQVQVIEEQVDAQVDAIKEEQKGKTEEELKKQIQEKLQQNF